MTEFFHLDAATGCVAHEEKMERLNIPEEKGRFAEWVLEKDRKRLFVFLHKVPLRLIVQHDNTLNVKL